jgi:hypothetical protein
MTDVQEQQRRTYRAWLRGQGVSQHPAESTVTRILFELETLEKRGDRIAAQLRSTAGDDATRRRAEKKLDGMESRHQDLYDALSEFPEEYVEAIVELSDDALDALRSLATQLRRDTLVFPGPKGDLLDLAAWRRREAPGKSEGAWTRALREAGLIYRPPSQMRHTFATLALADGAYIDWISKQMGHSSTEITERSYRKWLNSDRRNISILNAARIERTGLKADSVAGVAT